MEIKVRHMEERDNEDLFEIYSFPAVTENTSQLPFLSSNKVASLFLYPNCYTLVAEHEGKVLGHVTLFLSDKVRDKHCGLIALAVHPKAHRKGIGRTLLLEAINQADNWVNLVRLELEVQADNLPAIALYESVGFQLEGVKRMSTFKAGRYTDLHLMARLRPDL
uniref:GNAT family N-acetyltransferase n=1 Tax=Thaumasiovibrio occultus TaxID=1891184 RepID=UPI000B35F7D7|nr:GNAT family N-acetyltransferase [Thaumasiovibrio occultus]